MINSDVFSKIEQHIRKMVELGEKPPYVLTLDHDDIMRLMNPDGSILKPIFKSEDETEKLMAKVPNMVGRYKDVYIIQNNPIAKPTDVLTPKGELDILELGYKLRDMNLPLEHAISVYNFLKETGIRV